MKDIEIKTLKRKTFLKRVRARNAVIKIVAAKVAAGASKRRFAEACRAEVKSIVKNTKKPLENIINISPKISKKAASIRKRRFA